jgi:hypothetical protein
LKSGSNKYNQNRFTVQLGELPNENTQNDYEVMLGNDGVYYGFSVI